MKSAAATITKTRPVIYLENDVREKSAPLLEHLMANEYTLYWHRPPIFEADNFFGNPINHWAPQNIVILDDPMHPKRKSRGYLGAIQKSLAQG